MRIWQKRDGTWHFKTNIARHVQPQTDDQRQFDTGSDDLFGSDGYFAHGSRESYISTAVKKAVLVASDRISPEGVVYTPQAVRGVRETLNNPMFAARYTVARDHRLLPLGKIHNAKEKVADDGALEVWANVMETVFVMSWTDSDGIEYAMLLFDEDDKRRFAPTIASNNLLWSEPGQFRSGAVYPEPMPMGPFGESVELACNFAVDDSGDLDFGPSAARFAVAFVGFNWPAASQWLQQTTRSLREYVRSIRPHCDELVVRFHIQTGDGVVELLYDVPRNGNLAVFPEEVQLLFQAHKRFEPISDEIAFTWREDQGWEFRYVLTKSGDAFSTWDCLQETIDTYHLIQRLNSEVEFKDSVAKPGRKS